MAQQKMSQRDAVKLLNDARTREVHLSDLTLRVSSRALPDKYLTAAFDVFHSHLRIPVDHESLDNIRTCRVIVYSILGLGSLRDTYFSQHIQQLRQCWPDLVNWSKALFRGRKYREDCKPLRSLYFAINRVFDTVAVVDLDLVDNDDIFHFAVELWKGDEEDALSPERYATGPLIACLSKNPAQVNSFCERSAYDPYLFVETILARFHAAIFTFSTRRTDSTSDLADLLRRIVACSVEPILQVILNSKTALPILSRGLNSLLDDAHQTGEHNFTVRCAFEVIATFIGTKASILPATLRAGLLRVLLAVAANRERYYQGELAIAVIQELQTSLVIKSVVSAAVTSMNKLASNADFDMIWMLHSMDPEFRSDWLRFETLLIENHVVFELIGHGYTEERGTCASCRKKCGRKELRKCAGCEINFYCSAACARDDWLRHRVDCKAAGKETERYSRAAHSRTSRRFATSQVNRFWPGIVALARRRKIPIEYLGVHLYHTAIPFKFDVFDCRKILIDEASPEILRKSSILALLTKETLRARVEEKDKSCIMLVIDTMWLSDVPYRVYLDEYLDDDAEMACSTRSTFCVTGDSAILYPMTRDSVEEVLSEFYALPNLDWRTIWRDKAFECLARRR
ncbi:hypothetical protein SCHPADRAFT_132280 [Schizopora paradoxa]|uniref:MYND-type domain-containing protein n=1 Tax=Schizopora paradoxa TaxID=27342 RepID=A0A0H2S1H0_9AGAM|nr:hypothetical protein SCHPADRAFT_132280 [Schizopora paradoxa]